MLNFKVLLCRAEMVEVGVCLCLQAHGLTHPLPLSLLQPLLCPPSSAWMEEQTHLDIWDGKGDEVPALRGDGDCSLSNQLT